MKALMLAAGLVSAAAAAAPPPQADLPEAKDDDQARVVCIQSNEIGSRLRQRRTCRTKAQWDEYRQGIRGKVARMQATREAPGD
jgi:hypothetical protein